jgi:hypothetical protein
MLVARDEALLEHARAFRNYGKPEHAVSGLNFRLSEFTAAIGLVQAERMDEIVAWKNEVARELLDPAHPGRLRLPDGMTSGYYKYVVFDPIEKSTGKVYDQPCHRIMGHAVDLPNADWIAANHWCVPLYYRPEATAMASSTAGSAASVARHEPGDAQSSASCRSSTSPARRSRVTSRAICAAVAPARQSRPQRDHSSGVRPRRLISCSEPSE